MGDYYTGKAVIILISGEQLIFDRRIVKLCVQKLFNNFGTIQCTTCIDGIDIRINMNSKWTVPMMVLELIN